MISILGRSAVLLGLGAAAMGVVTAAVAAKNGSKGALRASQYLGLFFAFTMVLSTSLMEVALLTHDFSVSYVAEVGSRSTPTWVTIVSLWSSLDGSILLWGFVLGLFQAMFTLATWNKHPLQTPWALAVSHGVAVFFTFLIAGVANPFTEISPVPTDGPGPNPLLQNHILMVIHPPMLYLGYVGMTVPFAMAAAALLAGRLDAAWVRLLRRWVLIPWGFLTAGIILGGWWSYEVLGWGGWWAWDPVENASFLPWLTATAFLHSAMVMERQEQLRGWTLSLVLGTFLLTLLGTFMTRSGVFNSVHSFTQSPIGPVFLGFLALCLIFSLFLLAFRLDALAPRDPTGAGLFSKETSFAFNNLLFSAFTFMVLMGTTYPLLNEALTDQQISVGQPWFDKYGAPIGLAILFLMGVGPALPWGREAGPEAWRRLGIALGSGVLVSGACLALGLRGFWPVATFGVAGFTFVVTLDALFSPAQARAKARGEGLLLAMFNVATTAHRRYAGYLVHIGVLLVIVGHAAATAYQTREKVTLVEGQSATVGDYALRYTGPESQDQPHRRSLIARFEVSENGQSLGVLEPRLNHYKKMGQPIGTPEVRSGPTEDLYLSLVNIDTDAKTASLEVLIQPLVGWIWVGGGLMALGTFLSLLPARRPKVATAPRQA